MAQIGDPPVEQSTPEAARAARAARRRPPTEGSTRSATSMPEACPPGSTVPNDRQDLGLLVFLHGGGWVIGDLDSHDNVCRRSPTAAAMRCSASTTGSRPEHPFPAPLEDAVAATRWAYANAATLGCRPDRLAIGGDSAGGNLAAAVAQLGPVPLVYQLLVYPVTDCTQAQPSHDENARPAVPHQGRDGAGSSTTTSSGARARRTTAGAPRCSRRRGAGRHAAGARDHRRVRPVARRGRRLRGSAGRRSACRPATCASAACSTASSRWPTSSTTARPPTPLPRLRSGRRSTAEPDGDVGRRQCCSRPRRRSSRRSRRREQHRVEDDADHQDDQHPGHQPRGVGELALELQPTADRRLVGDDHQQLAGHQAAPGERPALLEPGHERGQRRRQHDVAVGAEPVGAEHPAGAQQQRRDLVDAGDQPVGDRRRRADHDHEQDRRLAAA